MSPRPRCPNGGGTGKSRTVVPDGTCDAHMHVYDRRFAIFGSSDAALVDFAIVDENHSLQSAYLELKKQQ